MTHAVGDGAVRSVLDALNLSKNKTGGNRRPSGPSTVCETRKHRREPGAILSMGGDWPVESLNPFPLIQTGATRRTGKNAFFPNRALTLDHMLAGYTRTNAYAEFMEKQIGSLETGKLADLIVLFQDLYKIPAVQIGKTKVLLTMVDGRIVWWSGLQT